ncbi:MAG: septal ring lytic transglycosylase RlpA family protein [Deltaproteobacteria bacterium]|nr:septal ring lytic transglycosylase RlpA family protein [Deltaproteobacteria bacterium]
MILFLRNIDSIITKSSFFRRIRAVPLLLSCTFFYLVIGCAATYEPPPKQPAGYPKPYKVFGKWYQPLPHSKGFRQRGIASWYGKDFHGKKTANGEIYDMYAVTAAHKTLPLGTYVRVHNLENNRKIDVRINDRGPFVRGRIIDLSYTAAKDIGIVGPGTARVEVFALGTPAATDGGSSRTYVQGDYFSGNFTYQVGAFVNRENAERQTRELEKRYKNAHITVFDRGDQIFYRVRIGKFTTLEDAVRHEEILIQDGYPDAILIAE